MREAAPLGAARCQLNESLGGRILGSASPGVVETMEEGVPKSIDITDQESLFGV